MSDRFDNYHIIIIFYCFARTILISGFILSDLINTFHINYINYLSTREILQKPLLKSIDEQGKSSAWQAVPVLDPVISYDN